MSQFTQLIHAHYHEVARWVKLADLEDNSRFSRTILRPDRVEPDIERVGKYLLA